MDRISIQQPAAGHSTRFSLVRSKLLPFKHRQNRVPQDAKITNIVKAFSTTHDTNTANNTASTSFIVGGLEIEKKVSSDTAYAGTPFDYTIIVTNTSNSSIGALVKDIFTTTLDIIDCNIYAVSGSSKCYVANRTLNTYISIPAGQKYELVVTVRGNKDIGDIPKTSQKLCICNLGFAKFHPQFG